MFYGITGAKTYPLEQSNPHHGILPHKTDHSYAILIVLGFAALNIILNAFDIT